jgi:hypothetical protein
MPGAWRAGRYENEPGKEGARNALLQENGEFDSHFFPSTASLITRFAAQRSGACSFAVSALRKIPTSVRRFTNDGEYLKTGDAIG